MRAELGAAGGFIPKGAKNVGCQGLPEVPHPAEGQLNEYLKTGLGRWLPAMPQLVKEDPFWLDPEDPHRTAYVTEGLLGPTVPDYPCLQSGLRAGPSRAGLGHRAWPTS